MRTEWHSPHDLCEYLGLTPTPVQRAVFDNFTRGNTDFLNDDETMRGLCVALLWETLSHPGRTTTIVGEQRLRGWVMQFLMGLIIRREELGEVCGMGRWDIAFGTDPGWRIRAAHPNPACIEGIPAKSTVVLLGAAEDWAVEVEPAARASGAKVMRAF